MPFESQKNYAVDASSIIEIKELIRDSGLKLREYWAATGLRMTLPMFYMAMRGEAVTKKVAEQVETSVIKFTAWLSDQEDRRIKGKAKIQTMDELAEELEGMERRARSLADELRATRKYLLGAVLRKRNAKA